MAKALEISGIPIFQLNAVKHEEGQTEDFRTSKNDYLKYYLCLQNKLNWESC